jgi:hypothetical protein
VAADDKRLQALLGQLVPRTRDIVLRTPIAGDVERLESLLTLTPSNQSVVARRLDMAWTWDDALKLLPEEPSNEGVERADAQDGHRAHAAETTDTANAPKTDIALGDVAEQLADLEARPGSSDENCHVVLVRLNELRPNSINATIYRESLDDARLRDLADHIAEYGQREPIIVDSSLMILSGERRWRALRLIGAEYARVVVDPTQRTADEVEDLVLDDFSLKRKPSVEEQLNVYDAAVRSYTRRYGRATGRPRKGDKNLSGFWDAHRIRDEAAVAAGLGSRETVRHAKWVLKHGDSETKAAMLCRGITINAAYVGLQEAREDESGTDTRAPQQLPNGSCTHLRLVLPQPSSTEGEPQRAGEGPGTAAPSGEEQPSRCGVPAATPEGADSAIAHGHEGQKTGTSEVSPAQTAASEASSHLPPSEGAPGPNGHGPEVRPAASTKARAASKREREPDARSFDRGITAAARYVSALRKRDEVEALSARDKAIAILTAAANGDGNAERQVAGIEDEKAEGAEQDSVLDEGGLGSSEENRPPDDAEVDLTASPEEAEGESSTSTGSDNPYLGSQEDIESGGTDDDDEVNALAKVKRAEFDYSDYYYDVDDRDESDDAQSDADDDDQVGNEDEWEEDAVSDEDDELKDPLDAEVDELVGRARAR